MFNRFLKSLPRTSYVVFNPAQDSAITFAQNLFRTNNLAPLPKDYVTFLKITDGFAYNGTIFYGIRSKDRKLSNGRGYFFVGLLEANLEFANKPDSLGKVLLGQTPERAILYSEADSAYLLQDMFSKEIIYKIKDFSDLLTGLFL